MALWLYWVFRRKRSSLALPRRRPSVTLGKDGEEVFFSAAIHNIHFSILTAREAGEAALVGSSPLLAVFLAGLNF